MTKQAPGLQHRTDKHFVSYPEELLTWTGGRD